MSKKATITLDRTDTGRFVVTCQTQVDDQPHSLEIHNYATRIKGYLAFHMLQSIYRYDLSCEEIETADKLQAIDARMM